MRDKDGGQISTALFDDRFNVFAIFTPLYSVQIKPTKYSAHACPKMALPNPLF
jgi:hypothetical protein